RKPRDDPTASSRSAAALPRAEVLLAMAAMPGPLSTARCSISGDPKIRDAKPDIARPIKKPRHSLLAIPSASGNGPRGHQRTASPRTQPGRKTVTRPLPGGNKWAGASAGSVLTEGGQALSVARLATYHTAGGTD